MTSPLPIACFADEAGIPMILDGLGGRNPLCLVIDPKREAARCYAGKVCRDLPVLSHPPSAHHGQWAQRLSKFGSALGVVASYGRILWPDLIAAFPLGVVNLHGGRLPEYRGANVLQWAILNGERETAMTLHYVDEGVDTGPIIAEKRVPVQEEDTAFSLRERLGDAGSTLLVEWLPRLLEGRVPAVPQDERRARTWPRRRPEDGRIDWSWPDERIRNLTRALVKPWPGAFYTDRSGRRVVVDRALSLEEIRAFRREVAG